MEYFQLVTQLSQAQAAAFVLDMRRGRDGATVDQMVALYFDKLPSGEFNHLLQIVELATPSSDRPAPTVTMATSSAVGHRGGGDGWV